MFHSAGYFRGVRCPFFEHGLCHRPHCHYKHSTPDTVKRPIKIPLKLRPKFYKPHPPDQKPQSSESTQKISEAHPVHHQVEPVHHQVEPVHHQVEPVHHQVEPVHHQVEPVHEEQEEESAPPTNIGESKEPVARGGASEGLPAAVPEVVVEAIEQISNYFGSTTSTTSGNTSDPTESRPLQVKSSDGEVEHGRDANTVIGKLSHEDIGRLAGEIADQLVNTSSQYSDVPCYAPEKCNDAPPYTRQECGKGSSEENTTSDTVEPAPESDEIAKLEDMLVTEKDIFGGPGLDEELCKTEVQPDTCNHGDDGEGDFDAAVSGGDGSDGGCYSDDKVDGGGIGDNDAGGLPLEEEKIMEEFRKITSFNEENIVVAHSKKRKEPDNPYDNDIPVKKKRVAYQQAEMIGSREPPRTTPSRNRTVNSNFSSMVSENNLFVGKERVANQTSLSQAVKRPRLPLLVNAKISTKVRQNYLDSFIDEHMKMGIPPEDAYQKAMEEEKALFVSIHNSRSSYLNKSYSFLKELRAKSDIYVTEQRRRSDERVEQTRMTLLKKSAPVAKTHARKGNTETSCKTVKKYRPKLPGEKVKCPVKKGGWESLSTELQASFNHPVDDHLKTNNPRTISKASTSHCNKQKEVVEESYSIKISSKACGDTGNYRPSNFYSSKTASMSSNRLSGDAPSTSKIRSSGDAPSTSKIRSSGDAPSTSKIRSSGDAPSTSKIRSSGDAPSTSKIRSSGDAPSTSKIRSSGDAPSTSKIRSSGDAPSTSKIRSSRDAPSGDAPSTSKIRSSRDAPSTSKIRSSGDASTSKIRSSRDAPSTSKIRSSGDASTSKIRSSGDASTSKIRSSRDAPSGDAPSTSKIRSSRDAPSTSKIKSSGDAPSTSKIRSSRDAPSTSKIRSSGDASTSKIRSSRDAPSTSKIKSSGDAPSTSKIRSSRDASTTSKIKSSDTPSTSKIRSSDTPSTSKRPSDTPSTRKIRPSDTPSASKIRPSDTPSTSKIRPSDTHRDPLLPESPTTEGSIKQTNASTRSEKTSPNSNKSSRMKASQHSKPSQHENVEEGLGGVEMGVEMGVADPLISSGSHQGNELLNFIDLTSELFGSDSESEGSVCVLSDSTPPRYSRVITSNLADIIGEIPVDDVIYCCSPINGIQSSTTDEENNISFAAALDNAMSYKKKRMNLSLKKRRRSSKYTWRRSGEDDEKDTRVGRTDTTSDEDIKSSPHNIILKKVPSLCMTKVDVSEYNLSTKSSNKDVTTPTNFIDEFYQESLHFPDKVTGNDTTSSSSSPLLHEEMTCGSRTGQSSSPRHMMTQEEGGVVDEETNLSCSSMVQMNDDDKTRKTCSTGKRRRTSSSSSFDPPPSHHPCGPYIKLSRLSLQQKQSSSSSSKLTPHYHHLMKKPSNLSRPLKKGGNFCGKPKTQHLPIPKSSSSNFTILKKRDIPPLTNELFYAQMWKYVLTEDQLYQCGYPRATSKPGVATINREGQVIPKLESVGPNAMRHECCRCHKPFIIYNDGQYQTVETCSYHYGKAFKYKEYGEGVVSKYSCCQERSGSPGCQIAKLHVTSGAAPSQESGYVKAPPSDHTFQMVYALDCEMCYTTLGLELTRVSVIDLDCTPVYETLVKPSHTIVDYNTRFSGLTAQSLVNVTTTLSQVQDDLLHLFSSETILVGHSLESDFKALKLIHDRVVDTALVFPHKLGLPYKKALRTLAKDILHKFIQNDIDDGHDSLEDSRACMELMIWKVKSDLKAMCRRNSSKH